MPEFAHKPVMLAEVLEALKPTAGERYADGTLGGAGHAAAILAASSPTGWVYGCDRDGVAVAAAQEKLLLFAGRFEIRRGNFSDLADWVPPESCAGVLFDLGVSSVQLDRGERGFSFQQDGPLDMRMDDRQPLTAADLVNTESPEELARIFWEYADERDSRRFAKAIVMDRAKNPFKTTSQLAGLIERLSPWRGKTHPATKVFQALRVAVNDELGSLRRGLNGALKILKSGGRLAVITFSSIEDRMVKDFGRERARDYVTPAGGEDIPELRVPRTPEVKLVTRKAIQPSAAEVEQNPRARSAQLRVVEKI